MARITRYTPTRLTPPGDPLGNLYGNDSGFTWPMTRLHQEIDRLFSDAFRGIEEGGEGGRRGWMFSPVVDVEQQDNQYEISVELPGVRKEDVNVELNDDLLTISGSKERKETRGEGENRQSERIYGSFQRAFRLPEDAVRDQIQAQFSDGVLTLSVPRDASQRQPQARRIEVRSEASRGIESGQQQQQPQQPPSGAAERGEQEEQPRSRH